MTNKKSGSEREALLAQLTDLGLASNDARVYLYLLERGVAYGGSKIATLLGLHRQYVHTSLGRLLALDLLEEVPDGARMKYKAMPPRYVTHMARRKLEEAERVSRELETISAVGADQDFEIYQGARQILDFEERLVDALKESETQYIIGGGAEAFVRFFGEHYAPISEMAKAKRLKSFYVGGLNDEKWIAGPVRDIFKDDFQFRTLASLPTTYVQTVVRFDTVTLYTFGNPPLVYFIKSKTIADDYKKYFDMLWEMAATKK